MKDNVRAVVDANVLVSAVLILDSVPARCIKYLMEFGQLIVSNEVFDEYVEVLSRPKFDRYVGRSRRDAILERIAVKSNLVEIVDKFSICRDPKDNKYLEAAYAGHAEILLTGDRDLLELEEFQGTAMVEPSRFLERIPPNR